MQGKSLPRKIKEKVLDLFQQGCGYCAVAKILGLNESTIKTYSLLYRSGDETSWVNSKAQLKHTHCYIAPAMRPRGSIPRHKKRIHKCFLQQSPNTYKVNMVTNNWQSNTV